MRTPLAWRNIMQNKVRSFIAMAAIAFAIVLIFMQLALYELCLISAVLTYEMVEFDAILVSSQYVEMAAPASFSQNRLYQCLEVPGMARATPFYLDMVNWRNPENGLRSPILFLGVPPSADIFRVPEVRQQQDLLKRRDAVLVDRMTQPTFGPLRVGLVTEAGGKTIEVAGFYRHGIGFTAGGAMVGSDATFAHLTGKALDHPQFGLLVFQPGLDTDEMVRRLNRALPPDVRVLSRARIEAMDQHQIVDRKPVGIMFSSGVVLGFVIGAVILYQVMASDILKRIREYATLKAMGYTAWRINRIVFEQAFLFAILGYVPALFIAAGLYATMHAGTNLPVYMTLPRALLVLAMAIAMCLGSAFLGIRKVRTADPAELFM